MQFSLKFSTAALAIGGIIIGKALVEYSPPLALVVIGLIGLYFAYRDMKGIVCCCCSIRTRRRV
jgi:hypothetical protein